MEQPLKTTQWKALNVHAESLLLHMPQYFIQHHHIPSHVLTATACGIHLDYSKQHLTQDTLKLLFSLANACQLRDKITALMRGDSVNLSENRAALHTALRLPDNASAIIINHQNILTDIIATRDKMRGIAEKIRANNWFGYSGKAITDIVNIGIGGSDLGPQFCLEALADFTLPTLSYHFISDADPTSFKRVVKKLSPDTTLFIISSKSFTTKETLFNAKQALDWVNQPQYLDKHFIAVTAHPEKAHQLGINTILPIWEWVGGRYSFCSAINLIAAIAIGFESFSELLAGAYSMDQHFQHEDITNNLPILLALLGIWNNNFLHINNLLVLTYAHNLNHFVSYLQQLDMESNGKSIDYQGKTVNYATGPLVWGGSGNQAQHSYYQLLCQGTHKITADFITLNCFDGEIINDQCATQIKALTEGVNPMDKPHGYIPGNMPLNHIRLENCTPFTIGALIALYEHKIFTQSVIWNINPFDQPGVDSTKWQHQQNAAVKESAM